LPGTFFDLGCITIQWVWECGKAGAMNEDLAAIQRVLAGDVESFRSLVERYQRPLLTLVRNLTPRGTDHEGVAQEVFLAAYRSLASFDPQRAAFSTWLFTIARNCCLNELARRRPVARAELPDIVDSRLPECAASEAELIHQLDAALEALPFEQRCAFVLAQVQGLSYEEISRIEGVGLGTVKSRIARAREKLRSLLRHIAEPHP
jgi:RNA polymerase sigma-70 factor (ECF subfamily)